MERSTEFDDIRPYYDEELPSIFEELIEDPDFQKVIAFALPEMSFSEVADLMRQAKTKYDFQRIFSYSFLWKIADSTTDGIELDMSSVKANREQPFTYISNHRDIVLDSGFLSILLVSQDLDTVEIAIGDNLLFLPWIKKLVRVNKSFIVQRALSMRQMLEASTRLSKYMHYAINQKKESLWIAQREGRAKDSNDRTQDSVLKMLAMGGDSDIIDSLKPLNILPLSISYEYDPCDYLKAQEFQLKRDNPDYKKSFKDDLKNMETGIFGYKGKVSFRTGNPLNNQLDNLDRTMPKTELYSTISKLMDKEIHRNYTIYPINYLAHDMLSNANTFAEKYSEKDKIKIKAYLNKQLDKIELPEKDIPFLRERILTMYANPLRNHLNAIQ